MNDVEELSDRFFHRPLARPLVRFLLLTPVSPDHVTVLSAVAGLLAGVLLAFGIDRPAFCLASAGFLLGATVLDCVDGQLARARRTMSARGMALDTAADIVVAFSMGAATTSFVVRLYESPRLWLLAPIVLASYAVQCFFFDVIKERYLADHRISYDSSKAVHAARGPQRESPATRLWLFDLYWRVAGPIIRRSRAGPVSRAYVRAWSLLGPGTHMTCLYVMAAVASVWPPAAYVCLLVFAGGMNVLMVGLFLTNVSSELA